MGIEKDAYKNIALMKSDAFIQDINLRYNNTIYLLRLPFTVKKFLNCYAYIIRVLQKKYLWIRNKSVNGFSYKRI